MDLPPLPFTGTVAKGEDPKVDLTLKLPGQCESTDNFSGSYASKTKDLSLTGTITIFDLECNKIAELSTTLKLKK